MSRNDNISRLLFCNVGAKMSPEEMKSFLDDQTTRDLNLLNDAASRWTKNMIDDLLKSDFLSGELEPDTETVSPMRNFTTTNPRIADLGVELYITMKIGQHCSKHSIPFPRSWIEEIPESTQKQIVDPASSTNEDSSDKDEGPIDLSAPLTPPPSPVASDAISTSEDLIKDPMDC